MLDAVEAKLAEAERALARLAVASAKRDLYDLANAFLVAARSVVYVARHELGWEDRRSVERATIGAADQEDRKKFDRWCSIEPTYRSIINHRLSEARSVAVHRAGQAPFSYVSTMGEHTLVPGTAFRHSVVLRAGRLSLPLEDGFCLVLEQPDGSTQDGVQACTEYLELVRAFVHSLRGRQWE